MTRNPVSVHPDGRISEAAAEMARLKIRRLPVVQLQGGKEVLVGIVSKHDVLHAYMPGVNPFGVRAEQLGGERPVSEIMTVNPRTTTPDTPIEDVARILRDKKFGAMPVMLGDKLVGIITESDIFKAFVSVMGAEKSGVRITFEVKRGTDILTMVAQLARKRGLEVASVMSSAYDGQYQYVVRVHGHQTDDFVEDIWNSGHKVLNVLQVTAPEDT